MTVSTKNISQTFQGNDVAIEFGFQFPFFTKDEIDVYRIDKDSKETKLVFGTDYDIPGRRFPRGATVKLLKGPLASTDKLFVIRVIDYTQLTAFRNMGAYKAEAHENALDKLTMLVQQNLFNDGNNLKLNFAGDEWQTRGIPFDSIKSNSSVEGKAGSFDSLSVSDSASIKSLTSESASIDYLSSDLNASWNRITHLPPPSDDEEPMRKGDAIKAGAGPTFKYVDDKASQTSNAGDSQGSGGLILPVENRSAVSGEVLTDAYYIKLIGGDFTSLTRFRLTRKDGSGDALSGALSNINLTSRPYSVTVGVIDAWITDIRYQVTPIIDVRAFWVAADGSGSDSQSVSAAHDLAEILECPVDYGSGKTYSCANFKNNKSQAIGDNCFWKIGDILIPVPSRVDSTTGENTVYVSPTGSDTDNNGLTVATPFRTMQHASNKVPTNIHHRTIVQLSNEVHNEGSADTDPIAGASTVRTVRCLVHNKNIAERDQLVFQGDVNDKSLCTIQYNDAYSALYSEETNGVVLKDVTLDCSLNPDATIGVFQHRKGDMRCSDITVNGNDKNGSHAFIAETGGFIEFAGDIEINKIERALVSLEAIISFIGTRLSHDGGTAGAPRTFECGSQGQIYMFSGLLNTNNVQRVIWNKGGFVLCSPSSHTHSNVFGFAIDIVKGAEVEARRIRITGGALGVNNQGGLATLNLCNFNNQTTSAVVNRLGGKVIIDNCTIGDDTQTKALVDSEGGEVYIFGDGDITGGRRGVYAKNTQLEIGEQMNISGNIYNLDARECITRIVGTLANPVTMNGGLENSIKTIGGSLHHQHLSAKGVSGKNVIDAIGTTVHNGGNVNLDGGYIGVNLSQNASYTAEGTSPNQIHNMTGFGIRALRGAQVYYRATSFTFTGTPNPTSEETAKSAHVTSF